MEMQTKQGSKEGSPIQVCIRLIGFVSVEEENDEYILEDDMLLLKGFVSLNQEDKAVEIKEKITSLFRIKYPLINSGNYDYVKRERNRISTPVTDMNFDWNFAALRGLCGQGKLYCRLNVLLSYVKDDSDDDDNAGSPQPSTTGQSTSSIETGRPSILTSTGDSAQEITTIISNDTDASSSLNSATDRQNGVDQQTLSADLIAIPGSSTASSQNATEHVTDLSNLVHELLDKQNEKDDTKFDSLESALTYVKSKLGDMKECLRVSPDNALDNALAYYKSSDFQPNIKLAFQYKGQAAIDTDGVLRQFYSDVFCQRRCIVQVGVGPACLSLGVFKYFVTGDLTEAIICLSVEDATNPTLKGYMKLIFGPTSETDESALQKGNSANEFQLLVSESGLTQLLTSATKDSMVQSLVYQDVIGKRIVALQQIRKGMEILGFFYVLAKSADLLEPLFVYKADQLTFNVIAEKLSSPELNEEHRKVHDYLMRFLEEADTKKLEIFIQFFHWLQGAAFSED
eukprot:Seg143.7 transcript_id=Seg143.7/GoldUCD/mRNA.D3Y31 product="hypothetical protein" protein_id=Seg143.7/GoldUCD/D3Y31